MIAVTLYKSGRSILLVLVDTHLVVGMVLEKDV
jgi:hypothetical protein